MRIVWSDEAQKRLTVVPGTVSGSPASSAARRPRFMPCFSCGKPQPTITSTTSSRGTAAPLQHVVDREREQVVGPDVGERPLPRRARSACGTRRRSLLRALRPPSRRDVTPIQHFSFSRGGAASRRPPAGGAAPRGRPPAGRSGRGSRPSPCRARRPPTDRGEAELQRRVVVEVRDGDADESETAPPDDGLERREEAAGHGEDALGLRGRVRKRVRARRPREVVEANAEHDRPADAMRLPHAAGDALDKPDQDRVDLLARAAGSAEGALRPDRSRACRPDARDAGRGCERARADAGRRLARASRRAPARVPPRPARR